MWKFESGQPGIVASFLGNSEIKMAFITQIFAEGQSLVLVAAWDATTF